MLKNTEKWIILKQQYIQVASKCNPQITLIALLFCNYCGHKSGT